MNIGIDYHDTITYVPLFFLQFLEIWKDKKIIITGMPKSKKELVIQGLLKLGFSKDKHYDKIEYGYEYEASSMDFTHFNKMAHHKYNIIKENNIHIYFDDNPYYCNYMKERNIIVFQPILSSEYIIKFNQNEKYFTCNLQQKQFDFLENFNIDKKKAYIPGCFDMFHIGHLKLLKYYYNLNYSLIIGVCDDFTVQKTKNKLPIMNTEERINLIKELDFITDVIPYTNLNQTDILKKYSIEVFIIGPEYGTCQEHIDTLQYCEKNGIEIIISNRTKGISTTDIISRIISSK